MDKKILIGSIIAVVVLVLVSSTSAVIDNSSRGEEYIYYYNPDTFGYIIWGGCNPPCYLITAIRLTQDELSVYSGWNLTKVKVMVNCDAGQEEVYARLVIYGEGNATHPGSIIYEKPDLYFDTTGFHTIEVDEPVALDDYDEIWVAVRWEIIVEDSFPVVVDEGPAVDGKGDWAYFNNVWSELQANPYLDCNWAMGAIVQGEGKAELSIVNVTGPIGVNAGVRNIGDKAVVNLEYEMTVTGGILGLVNRTKDGSKTTLNPGAIVPISSGLIVGFGPITINITAEADNAFKVATTKTGFILGPFVFGIE